MSFRASFRRIHKWTGIGFALLLLIQAVSGLALVYRDNIQRFLLSDHLHFQVSGDSLNVDAMLQHAGEGYPEYEVKRIDMRDSGTDMSMLHLQHRMSEEKIYALANPESGEIIRELSAGQSLPFALFEFHKALLSGDVGHIIVAVEGAALIFLVCGGIYLWWPGRKRAVMQKIRNVPKAIATFNLHRNVGIFSAPFLLVMAITGTVILIKILMAAGKPAMEPNKALPAAVLGPAIYQLIQTDGRVIRDLRFSADGNLMTVNLEAENQIRPLATDRVMIDRHSGNVVARHFASDEEFLPEIYNWMYPLHSGKFLGWVGRAFATSCGLLLMALIFFGVRLFMERNRIKQRKNIMRGETGVPAEMADLHS